jgi:hypothetical protein
MPLGSSTSDILPILSEPRPGIDISYHIRALEAYAHAVNVLG